MKPLVKICGLTRAADVELAIALGATHVGFVVAPDSPRNLQFRALVALAGMVPRSAVQPVLVGRSVPARALAALAQAAAIGAVQLHGATRADHSLLAGAGLASWRVYAVAATASALPRMATRPTPARPAVMDSGRGGSGRAFPWALLGPRAPAATFIAGGITPDNLGGLLARHPWGLDVGSGVESRPGHKDPSRMRALFALLDEPHAA